jgi:hypothetical protein
MCCQPGPEDAYRLPSFNCLAPSAIVACSSTAVKAIAIKRLCGRVILAIQVAPLPTISWLSSSSWSVLTDGEA